MTVSHGDDLAGVDETADLRAQPEDALAAIRAGADRPYRLFFEAMADGALTVGGDGTVLFANPRIAQMTGIPCTELVGSDAHRVFAADSRPELRSLLHAPHPIPVELDLAGSDGPTTVSAIASPLDLDGTPVTCLVLTDVTQRTRAESTRSFHANLLDVAGEAIMASDAHGVIVYANPAAERLFGWDLGEAIGRTVLETATSDDVSARLPEAMAKLRSGKPWTGEVTLGHDDGTMFPAYVSQTPVFDDRGNLVTIIAVVADISERKAAEEALAASERRFETLVSNSGDLFAITDEAGIIRSLEGPVHDVLGVDRDALPGASIFDLVATRDLERARAQWQLVLDTTDVLPAEEYWTLTAAGIWICLSVTSTNLLDDPDVGGIITTARDVTERANLNQARRALSDANKALVRARSEAELLSDICDVIVAGRTYTSAWIGVPDDDAPLGVRLVVASGGADRYVTAVEASTGGREYRGPLAVARATRQVQIVQDIASLDESARWRPHALDHGYRSAIALPLGEDTDLGVLAIYARDPGVFSEVAVDVLRELAGDVSYGIRSLRTRAERRDYRMRFEASLDGAVKAIASAAELRDAYTAGHQRRVAGLATAIAEAMDIDPELVRGIGVSASIHDIGKLAIPAEILSRPGHLSEAETRLIRQHSASGADIIAGIDFPWPVADMVRQHHERLDGSGYPDGLRGDQILLGARIIAVADTVEAMQGHRPYRPAMGADAALEQIARDRGIGLDADAVDACTTLFQGGYRFTSSSREE